MARLFAAAFLSVALLPVLASEPGQPLDCSDWTFQGLPLTCVEHPAIGNGREALGGLSAVDASGQFIVAVWADYTYGGITLERTGDPGTQVVGSLLGRFHDGDCADILQHRPPGMYVIPTFFDTTNGRLFIPILSCGNATSGCPGPASCRDLVVEIRGFPSAFEVQTTFDPNATFSFLVPSHPEGLPAADRFDTYWGPLPGPIDFTQAHPLQCGYPASPPHVGDYLTVADPLPNPSSGHGYYYVTAATYQGQTRYGRKASGGKLSGRDPALLPACVQP